jgi:hypothetical protein
MATPTLRWRWDGYLPGLEELDLATAPNVQNRDKAQDAQLLQPDIQPPMMAKELRLSPELLQVWLGIWGWPKMPLRQLLPILEAQAY